MDIDDPVGLPLRRVGRRDEKADVKAYGTEDGRRP